MHFKSLVGAAAIAFGSALAAAAVQDVKGTLAGGGDLTIRRSSDTLEIEVRGPATGIAHLCVSDGSRVRILHASAAAGEAVYERDDAVWRLRSGFDWKLRDAPNAAPTAEQVLAHFAAAGWSAETSRAGAEQRRFRVRDAGVRYIGIVHYTFAEPSALSHWPESMDDDCRAVKVVQGYLPDSATFRPDRWHTIRP